MNITLDASQTIGDFRRLSAETQRKLSQLVARTGLAIHRTAVQSIQRGSRTGTQYIRGSRVHRASAPGEPPKTDSGRLVSSIKIVIADKWNAIIGSDLEYAKWLEIGTARVKPRPWLVPAVERHRKTFVQGLRKVVG